MYRDLCVSRAEGVPPSGGRVASARSAPEPEEGGCRVTEGEEVVEAGVFGTQVWAIEVEAVEVEAVA
jgi:hypothetical protein